jgi:fumarate hydratase class I
MNKTKKTLTLNRIIGLIRDTSSSLPADVEKSLRNALKKEKSNSSAAVVLKTIPENISPARKMKTPLCQGTGTLTFFVNESLRRKVSPQLNKKAVAEEVSGLPGCAAAVNIFTVL